MTTKKKPPALPQNAATLAGKTSAPRRPWRVCVSQCKDVYGGNEHLAIIEDVECGLIIADIEEWVDRETAEIMAAGSELLKHLSNIVEMARSVLADWESGDLADAVRNLDRIASAAEVAIAKAHGHEQVSGLGRSWLA